MNTRSHFVDEKPEKSVSYAKDTIKSLVNSHLIDATVYVPFEEKLPYGFAANAINLASNVSRFTKENNQNVNYPDQRYPTLYERAAKYYGVPQDHLLLVRGSDEIIDIALLTFCHEKEKILIFSPTFPEYQERAMLLKFGCENVDLDDNFKINYDAAHQKLFDPLIKLVFICTPNNPTGNLTIDSDTLKTLLHNHPKKIFIVDEAYIEFSQTSFTQLVTQFHNLVVMRTLSKAHGLAGARIGFMIANADIISYAKKITMAYSVPTLTAQAAISALSEDNLKQTEEAIKKTVRNNQLMSQFFNSVTGLYALPSQSNFLLIRSEDAAQIKFHLQDNNILVKCFNIRGASYLRIAVGNKDDLCMLVDQLEKSEVFNNLQKTERYTQAKDALKNNSAPRNEKNLFEKVKNMILEHPRISLTFAVGATAALVHYLFNTTSGAQQFNKFRLFQNNSLESSPTSALPPASMTYKP